MTASPPTAHKAAAPWHARLELDFAARDGRTVIHRREHQGPLIVQRPFYPEAGGVSHVYVVHPPGGVVGGDTLELVVRAAPDAHALLTTPAAGKFYRSGGRVATQTQDLAVEDAASMEWLPQENIFFDGAEVALTTRVALGRRTRFIGWEIHCLGRPAGNAPFRSGLCRSALEVRDNDGFVFIDRARLEGGSGVLEAAWGLAGRPVSATLVIAPGDDALLEALRANVHAESDDLFGVTRLDGVLVCRFLGYHAEAARACFAAAWAVARPAVMGRPACEPRVWKT